MGYCAVISEVVFIHFRPMSVSRMLCKPYNYTVIAGPKVLRLRPHWGSLQRSSNGGDLVSSLNSATRNIKLPWAKFPGEMHLPGHQFTGPGIRLDLRLNPDGTPKDWSGPINRADNAAYYHDLAYDRYSDTASRNVADGEMLAKLNNIPNPTVRERIERAVVKPILSAKTSLGLGFKKTTNRKKS